MGGTKAGTGLPKSIIPEGYPSFFFFLLVFLVDKDNPDK